MAKRLKCKHCGYDWDYKGKMLLASCSSCARKIRVSESITTPETQEE